MLSAPKQQEVAPRGALPDAEHDDDAERQPRVVEPEERRAAPEHVLADLVGHAVNIEEAVEESSGHGPGDNQRDQENRRQQTLATRHPQGHPCGRQPEADLHRDGQEQVEDAVQGGYACHHVVEKGSVVVRTFEAVGLQLVPTREAPSDFLPQWVGHERSQENEREPRRHYKCSPPPTDLSGHGPAKSVALNPLNLKPRQLSSGSASSGNAGEITRSAASGGAEVVQPAESTGRASRPSQLAGTAPGVLVATLARQCTLSAHLRAKELRKSWRSAGCGKGRWACLS